MTPFPVLSDRLEKAAAGNTREAAGQMLAIAESVLENWIDSRAGEPTTDTKEGFRLLALHRQGAKGEPSFNACRETCREVAYHFNLIGQDPEHPETAKRLRMMGLVVNHLLLFVSGKMQVEKVGEFCCASRPLRSDVEPKVPEPEELDHA